jgi:hypothetical protein
MLRAGHITEYAKALPMTNLKLQVALDELERLRDTVREYESRNSSVPNPDSDVGRAVDSLSLFSSAMHNLNIGKLSNVKTRN